MKKLEHKIFASTDNLQLSVLLCLPDVKETEFKGVIQIVHGMCEYKERYIPFMEYMTAKGYVCVIHDHRGHGKNTQIHNLGYMFKGGWRAMVDDVFTVNEWVKSLFPTLKCILFGHSMGSMVVRSFTKRYDNHIDQLFVCGCPGYNPASKIAMGLAKVISVLFGGHYRPKLIQKLAFGSFNKPFKNEGYESAWVCSDKQTLEAYHHDSLCMFTFTANGFYNLFGLMQDCYSSKGWELANTKIPVVFISGGDDPCRVSDAKFYEAVQFMIKRGYKNTSGKLYKGMRHEILNETNKLLVWDDIANSLIV